MSNLQIHYDCDPGQDDAIALLFALGAGVDIKSISVIGGNVDVEKCTNNVLKILEFVERTDIPVYKGASQPLKRVLQPLPEVFGECGMAGANLPYPKTKELNLSAEAFLCQLSFSETVVATGPLTNLALAIQKNESVSTHIKNLFIMGGCIYPEHIHNRMGNIQVIGSEEWAEYNFAVDPEAAKIVFSAGIKNIFMIPVNVTRTILYRREIDNSLRECNKRVATLAANILATVGNEDRVDYASEMMDGNDPVRAIHDVVAMGYMTNPDIFEVEVLPIRIETGDPPKGAGQSLIDYDNPDHKSVTVIKNLDRKKFLNYLLEYMENL